MNSASELKAKKNILVIFAVLVALTGGVKRTLQTC